MSSFKSKATMIKAKLQQQSFKQNSNNFCSHKELRITRQKNTDNHQAKKMYIQQPIIIQKKTYVKQQQSIKRVRNQQVQKVIQKKQIQPFVPVVIPTRDRKMTTDILQQKVTTKQCQGNKQIQIQIQRDDKNKDCLKKLFKKVHKLTEQLKQSQSERIRLKLELENQKNLQKKYNDYQKRLNLFQCEKYKLQVEVDMLRRLLKDRDSQIQRHKAIKPKQIIKQVIVEKPVQIIVEVPRPVPGPQRIVQKIVEVPKYVQIEKKVPFQVIKQVVKTIQVPTVTQKIVYVDRPIYIDRQVPVHIDREIPIQVPVEVPIEKPVYIDRPYVQQQLLQRMRSYQIQIEHLMRINAQLDDQNRGLRITCQKLSDNIQILRRHNQEKNRQVEHLLQNSLDYNPCSPSQDYSLGSVKYTISSKNHKRVV